MRQLIQSSFNTSSSLRGQVKTLQKLGPVGNGKWGRENAEWEEESPKSTRISTESAPTWLQHLRRGSTMSGAPLASAEALPVSTEPGRSPARSHQVQVHFATTSNVVGIANKSESCAAINTRVGGCAAVHKATVGHSTQRSAEQQQKRESRICNQLLPASAAFFIILAPSCLATRT
jgi:hypothetical protein